MAIEQELKAVYADSLLELKTKYPMSTCRRPTSPGSHSYQGIITVDKAIQYSISCYRGGHQVWQVVTTELSNVTKFNVDSTQYRVDNFQGGYSIVIKQEYTNFPGHDKVLGNFCIANHMPVWQLATSL